MSSAPQTLHPTHGEIGAWEEQAQRYRLLLPSRPRAGLTGELLGRGAGSSIEFQDLSLIHI